MRLPRKGVLIRLAIYVPLIGFLSWNALQSCEARREAQEAAATPPEPSVQERLEPHKRIITLPDGSQQAVYELTPEEAQELLGAPVEVPDDAPPTKAEDERAPADLEPGD
jgi:hypothetical protein